MGKISFEKVAKMFSPRGLSIQKVYTRRAIPLLLKISGTAEFYVYYDGKKPFDKSFPKVSLIESNGIISEFLRTFVSPVDCVAENSGCLWISQDGTVQCYSENSMADLEIPIDYVEGSTLKTVTKFGPGTKFYFCIKWSELRTLLNNPMEDYLKKTEKEFYGNLAEHTKVFHEKMLKDTMKMFETPNFESILFLNKIQDILSFLS